MKKKYLLIPAIALMFLVTGCSGSKTNIEDETNKLKDTIETGASNMKDSQDQYWESTD